MKRLFVDLVIIIFGLTACNSGQSEFVVIEDSDFDFGIVPDSVQILHHNFLIENKSSDSCHITRIEKSCGCTKVKASNYTIAPFSSVSLNVEVDLGSNYSFFERDISVYTDIKDEPLIIFVRASRRMPNRIATKEFPVKISKNLRINMPYIIVGNVAHGESKSAFINILNTSNKRIHYSTSVVDAPSYISVFNEEVINPNEIGRIIMTFDLSEVNNIWGLQKHSLLIKTDEGKKEIPIEAIFVEDFAIKKTNARILIPTTNYTIDTSTTTEVLFCIKNVGTDVLYIRDIKTNGKIKSSSLSSYEVNPNEQELLIVNVEKNQNDNLEIGLTTNDYKEPYKIVRIFCNPTK